MLRSARRFQTHIADARRSTALYDSLLVSNPGQNFDDLLRFQIVHSVSAIDTLLHDLIRIGMTAVYSGQRTATVKYKSEPIPLAVHQSLIEAEKSSDPQTTPPEVIFSNEVLQKIRRMSFQEPTKIAEGLSFIWPENHKWAKISAAMSMSEQHVVTTLKLISSRRNAIVHEADIDPVTLRKNTIDRAACQEITDFIEGCGSAIARLVT